MRLYYVEMLGTAVFAITGVLVIRESAAAGP